jgi:hypothetical protein
MPARTGWQGCQQPYGNRMASVWQAGGRRVAGGWQAGGKRVAYPRAALRLRQGSPTREGSHPTRARATGRVGGSGVGAGPDAPGAAPAMDAPLHSR